MNDRIASFADYQQIKNEFCWDCPTEFNFGSDVVDQWAESHPDRLIARGVPSEFVVIATECWPH